MYVMLHFTGAYPQQFLKFDPAHHPSSQTLRHPFFPAGPPPPITSAMMTPAQSAFALNLYHHQKLTAASSVVAAAASAQGIYHLAQAHSQHGSGQLPHHAHSHSIPFHLLSPPHSIPEAHTAPSPSYLAARGDDHQKKTPALVDALLSRPGEQHLRSKSTASPSSLRSHSPGTQAAALTPSPSPSARERSPATPTRKSLTSSPAKLTFDLQREGKFASDLMKSFNSKPTSRDCDSDTAAARDNTKSVPARKRSSSFELLKEVKEELPSDEEEKDILASKKIRRDDDARILVDDIKDEIDEVDGDVTKTGSSGRSSKRDSPVEDVSDLIIGEVKLEMTADPTEDGHTCRYCQQEFHSPVDLHQHERYICKHNHDIQKVMGKVKGKPSEGTQVLDSQRKERVDEGKADGAVEVPYDEEDINRIKEELTDAATLAAQNKARLGSKAHHSDDEDEDEESEDSDEDDDEEEESKASEKPTGKAPAKKLTENQAQHLRACFRDNKKPGRPAMEEIAKIIGTTRKLVQVRLAHCTFRYSTQ